MALEFDSETHTYTGDGAVLPSVTQIIRFCDFDKIKKSNKGSDPFYRNRGTLIHELCQAIDYDGIENVSVPRGYEGYISAYLAFLRDYRITEWQYVEKPMGGAGLGYAGTVDRAGIISGRFTILDIKSGTSINKTALTAQLTGYDGLFEDRTFFPADLLGLQLQKTGKYRVIQCKYDPKLWNACFTIHKNLEVLK